MDNTEIITSQKGKDHLKHNGYMYRLDRVLKSGSLASSFSKNIGLCAPDCIQTGRRDKARTIPY